ncbi:hypothetical protein K3556_08640 [Aliiroseovarius sp. M344]|uniref:hypothetical protein n=1 Tax=Aliiroseovarius sp. M344 TaxID=2867010 RepID=UPI0021AD95B0|nr:hypothetical protein [Aliiroseovarius sp. M344]UWQ13042.1 hypothetical protein K3556_08640 [Aliiroseovarius sp. M344]
MLQTLGFIARYGRFVLVLGLVAGLVLPGVASALRPWLSELVLLLLFLTAFRVGLPSALDGLSRTRNTLGVVLVYQLVLPLLCIALFAVFGLAHSPVAIALTLMLAAPSLTANPNMAVLLGQAPEPAFRLLILGTLILPLTIIPIFWFSPALGDLSEAVYAALRLGLSICAIITLAFLLRAIFRPEMRELEIQALDGLTSLALAVIVVGLMSAVAPALSSAPWTLVKWLFVAMAANLGLQALAYAGLRRSGIKHNAAPMALAAGNRNVALFLVASSATQTDDFLLFLGCYQFPMYLTPILMRPLLGHSGSRERVG